MVVKFLRLGLIVTTYPRRRYTTAQRIADGDSELEDIGKSIRYMYVYYKDFLCVTSLLPAGCWCGWKAEIFCMVLQ
jgi:hypothetical protein